ncbi:hypothetical protein ACFC5X_19510 [Streptomyces sp. NPDC055952]|uniref:hypothetical protein n=1 Tax=Streptomyces sp. NPDC055952 TaxID=3345663 RepID=UPI0035D7ECB1
MTRRLRAALAMRRDMPGKLFSHADKARMECLCDLTSIVLTDFCSAEAIRVLGDIDVLITGWGAPVVDEHVLDRAPSLRVILDVTDCAKSLVDQMCWERGLTVTTAADANARPVAEYTLASILLAGKNVPALRHRYVTERRALDLAADHPDIGNAGRSVGIIGASRVGRRVLDLRSAAPTGRPSYGGCRKVGGATRRNPRRNSGYMAVADDLHRSSPGRPSPTSRKRHDGSDNSDLWGERTTRWVGTASASYRT